MACKRGSTRREVTGEMDSGEPNVAFQTPGAMEAQALGNDALVSRGMSARDTPPKAVSVAPASNLLPSCLRSMEVVTGESRPSVASQKRLWEPYHH